MDNLNNSINTMALMNLTGDLNDAILILQNWRQNHLYDNYNPTSVLVELIKIIHPKLLDSLKNISRSYERITGDFFTYLYNNNQDFIEKLLHDYSSDEYISKIGLNPKDSDKLKVASCYLTIVYMMYLYYSSKIDDGNQYLYSNVINWIFEYDDYIFYYAISLITSMANYNNNFWPFSTNQFNQLMHLIYTKLSSLLQMRLNDTDDQLYYKYNHYDLHIIKIRPADQQIYIYNFLNDTKANFRDSMITFISSQRVVKIFFKFLYSVWWNNDNDNDRIEQGYSCLSEYLTDDFFRLRFIEAGGLEKLLEVSNIGVDKMRIVSDIWTFMINEEAVMLICQKDDNIIFELISSVIEMFDDKVRKVVLLFLESAFPYEIFVRQLHNSLIFEKFATIIQYFLDEFRLSDNQFHNVSSISTFLNAIQRHAITHLYYQEMQLSQRNIVLAPHEKCSLLNEEIEQKIMIMQRLGKGDIFSCANNEMHKNCKNQFSNFIYLLLDFFKVVGDRKIYKKLEILKQCLIVLKIYSIDLTAVSAICHYNASTWTSEPIQRIFASMEISITRTESLTIINNCLRTLYCRYNLTGDSNSREIYDELLKMIKFSSNIESLLGWLNKSDNHSNWKLILSILVQLSMDEDIKKIFINYSANYLSLESLASVVSSLEDSIHILFHTYALELINLISIKKNFYANHKNTNNNITLSLSKRSYGLDKHHGYDEFICSKFLNTKKIKAVFSPDNFNNFSTRIDYFKCCEYSPCGQLLYVGTSTGYIKLYNTDTGIEKQSVIPVMSAGRINVCNIKINKQGDVMIMNMKSGARYKSCILNIASSLKASADIECSDTNFSNLQDKIIGSSNETALIYDLATKTLLKTLIPSVPSYYLQNIATFSMFDELVLNDGMLYDMKSGKEIYKFAKVNNTHGNGVFHPNGVEVIFNEYIWDLRTSRIINVAPALRDMGTINFSPINRTIFAVTSSYGKNELQNSLLKVVNSSTYALMNTYDASETKSSILSMACHPYDTEIAAVKIYFTSEAVYLAGGIAEIQFRNVAMTNSQ